MVLTFWPIPLKIAIFNESIAKVEINADSVKIKQAYNDLCKKSTFTAWFANW